MFVHEVPPGFPSGQAGNQSPNRCVNRGRAGCLESQPGRIAHFMRHPRSKKPTCRTLYSVDCGESRYPGASPLSLAAGTRAPPERLLPKRRGARVPARNPLPKRRRARGTAPIAAVHILWSAVKAGTPARHRFHWRPAPGPRPSGSCQSGVARHVPSQPPHIRCLPPPAQGRWAACVLGKRIAGKGHPLGTFPPSKSPSNFPQSGPCCRGRE